MENDISDTPTSAPPLVRHLHGESAAFIKALVRAFKLEHIDFDFRDVELAHYVTGKDTYYIEEGRTSITFEHDGPTTYIFGLELARDEEYSDHLVINWLQLEPGADVSETLLMEAIDLRREYGSGRVEVQQVLQEQDDGSVILEISPDQLHLAPPEYAQHIIDGLTYLAQIPNLPRAMRMPLALARTGFDFAWGE